MTGQTSLLRAEGTNRAPNGSFLVTREVEPMDYRSPLEDDAFPRILRRSDRRSIGQFESRLHGKNLVPSAGDGNWSPRRFVLSTVSVNTVLWAGTIFVIWWATSL